MNYDLPVLEHIHASWTEYLMLCGKLDSTLNNDFSYDALAARIQAQEIGAPSDLEVNFSYFSQLLRSFYIYLGS